MSERIWRLVVERDRAGRPLRARWTCPACWSAHAEARSRQLTIDDYPEGSPATKSAECHWCAPALSVEDVFGAEEEIMSNTELPPAALLASAARLIERARAQLNARSRRCETCGGKHYENYEEWNVYSRIFEMPAKLKAMAHDLEHGSTHPRAEALAEKNDRS